MRQLGFEGSHTADFFDGDPGKHDDHGHFEDELEEVGDQDTPQATNKGIDAGERDQEQDADEQARVGGLAEGVGEKIMAADADLQDAALGNGVAEQYGGDADHGFDDPTEDEAVHQAAKVDGAEAAEEGGGFAFIAELNEFDIGEDAGTAPVTREEEDGHHAGETLGPPDPVAGDAVAGDDAGDEERCIGSEGGGNHRGAGEPPGDVATGDEEFLGAAGGAAAIVEADEEVHRQVDDDYEPVDRVESHPFLLRGARGAPENSSGPNSVLRGAC